MAGHETYIGIVIGFSATAAYFLYLSSKVKKETVPRGRIFEKVMYHIFALVTIFALNVMQLIHIENTMEVNYLEDFMNAYFGISTTFILVMFFFYMYYMLRNSIMMFKDIKKGKGENL